MNGTLREIIAKAKKEYKAHPSKKWTTCVKEASKKVKRKHKRK